METQLYDIVHGCNSCEEMEAKCAELHIDKRRLKAYLNRIARTQQRTPHADYDKEQFYDNIVSNMRHLHQDETHKLKKTIADCEARIQFYKKEAVAQRQQHQRELQDLHSQLNFYKDESIAIQEAHDEQLKRAETKHHTLNREMAELMGKFGELQRELEAFKKKGGPHPRGHPQNRRVHRAE